MAGTDGQAVASHVLSSIFECLQTVEDVRNAGLPPVDREEVGSDN